jgi:hypothetical protein
VTTILKVVFTSPKEKMLRARASAERGERAGEAHSAGLVCWCRLPRDPVQPVLISDGGSKLRKNFFVVDNFSEERKNSKSLKGYLTLSLTAGGPIGQHFFECKML